ncbi:MAG: translation elongation factor Ts [Patescibacteria group bacterium]|nr:translation elongation factor Ts [Patescibacteria group bacterium]MDD5716063.1 translation elongation factor Ts [Patescibacteria group bacterium]
MPSKTSLIQQVREATGAGIMDSKKALEASGGAVDAAIAYLKKQGQHVAAKKQERTTKEGTIGSYIHANGSVAALVALACESDFVARTPDFQELAHDLAMQVAAADPQYIAPDNVPASALDEERTIWREQLKTQGKPEKMWDRIIDGKAAKYYSQVCLLKQPFIKDDSITIEQHIQAKIMKFGENIQVRNIMRMAL